METLGPTELLIILAIVLLVFGSARLPKLARSLGEAAHEFRRGTHHEPDVDAPDVDPPDVETPDVVQTGDHPAALDPPSTARDVVEGSEPETR